VDGYVLGQGGGPLDDADGDGISDAWESEHGLSPADVDDAEDDADGDGMSNYAEFRAGTDPGDAASAFRLEAERPAAGADTAGLRLRWTSASNRVYRVWRATNLVEGFTVLAEDVEATPPMNEYIDESLVSGGLRFYRIEVE
jgi:hypothetical protein